MLTFGITTSTKCASISLHNGNKLLGEITLEVSKTHSKTILDKIGKLFEWCEKDVNDVNNVVVSVGPGSFTGVRIAIAIVKGMFYGKNVNIYEVNELDALAYKCIFSLNNCVKKGEIVYSIVDSGKEKIYYSKYEINDSVNFKLAQLENYPLVAKLDNLIEDIKNEKGKNKIYIMGDGVINYFEKLKENFNKEGIFNVEILNDENLKISASIFYKMLCFNLLEKVNIFSLKPNYLEKSQAERDKK